MVFCEIKYHILSFFLIQHHLVLFCPSINILQIFLWHLKEVITKSLSQGVKGLGEIIHLYNTNQLKNSYILFWVILYSCILYFFILYFLKLFVDFG